MSSAPEYRILLVGSEVLADRTLPRHLRRQYGVKIVRRAAEVEALMTDELPARRSGPR